MPLAYGTLSRAIRVANTRGLFERRASMPLAYVARYLRQTKKTAELIIQTTMMTFDEIE